MSVTAEAAVPEGACDGRHLATCNAWGGNLANYLVDRIAEIQITRRVHREPLGFVHCGSNSRAARHCRGVLSGWNATDCRYQAGDRVDDPVGSSDLADDVIIRDVVAGLLVRSSARSEVISQVGEVDVVAGIDEDVEWTVDLSAVRRRAVGSVAACRGSRSRGVVTACVLIDVPCDKWACNSERWSPSACRAENDANFVIAAIRDEKVAFAVERAAIREVKIRRKGRA